MRSAQLVLCVCLLAAVCGYPAEGDKKDGSDNRVGLERPSTETPPNVSECNLDELIGSVFGGSGSSNCGGSSSEPSTDGGRNPPVDPYPDPQPPPPGPNTYPDPQPPPPGPNTYPDPQPPPPGPNPSPGDCQCVQYYLCDDNNTINDDGVGLIDIRIKEDECDSYLQKCCGGKDIRPPDNPVTPKPPINPTTSACGNRNTDGIGFRITGNNDNEAQYGEFPWMVAVIKPDKTLSSEGKTVSVYQCGGSLIHPQVVLTGAHCVRGKNNLLVRAGEWDTQTKNELYPTQDRNVRDVIIHEQFNNGTLAFDPALLILESPVDMSVENVGLICLPEQGENMDNRDCVASGWGKDQYGKEGKYQVILKRVDVPMVPRGQCLEALRKTRLGNRFKLHETFLCAGGRVGKDTCKGDGGSPLVCPSKNNPQVYVQSGIVAWGIDCGTATPGVYVNVPYFVNWITNKLQAQGISLGSSY